jgi:hypothetical protein
MGKKPRVRKPTDGSKSGRARPTTPDQSTGKPPTALGPTTPDQSTGKPPTSLVEAFFAIVWPIRHTALGLLAIVFVLVAGAVFAVFPDTPKKLSRAAVAEFKRLLNPPPVLTVLLPQNLGSLPVSVANIETAIKRRFQKSGSLQFLDQDTRSVDSQSVLSLAISLNDGLDAKVTLKTRGSVIGHSETHVPQDLLNSSAPYIVEGLLDALDVNWQTLERMHRPKAC